MPNCLFFLSLQPVYNHPPFSFREGQFGRSFHLERGSLVIWVKGSMTENKSKKNLQINKPIKESAIKWLALLRQGFHSLNSSPIEWQVINTIYKLTILVKDLNQREIKRPAISHFSSTPLYLHNLKLRVHSSLTRRQGRTAMEKKESAPATAELEIPGECQYSGEPAVVRPCQPTPRHTLYLSNLDDQRFLRFSIKYLYVFAATAAVPTDALRAALARVLVDYYPLAGRLRPSDDNEGKLVVDCNAEGALFAEGCLPGLTAAEFLRRRARPHKSWRKLLYRVEAQSFVAVPPLVVQVSRALYFDESILFASSYSFNSFARS